MGFPKRLPKKKKRSYNDLFQIKVTILVKKSEISFIHNETNSKVVIIVNLN